MNDEIDTTKGETYKVVQIFYLSVKQYNNVKLVSNNFFYVLPLYFTLSHRKRTSQNQSYREYVCLYNNLVF